MQVTLNQIRAYKPCVPSWNKLLSSLNKSQADDTQVSIRYIYETLGLKDALCSLRALPDSMDNSIRLLICDLVEPALQYTTDQRVHHALAVARAYANGIANVDQLAVARAEAWDARAEVWDDAAAGARAEAVWAAAGARAEAVWAAALAARAAEDDNAWVIARKNQEKIFEQWLELQEKACNSTEQQV